MRKTFGLLGLLLSLKLGATNLELPENLNYFAFGSCAKEWIDQPQIWDSMIGDKPQLYLWTGDAYYANTRDLGLLRRSMARQKVKPGYRRLRKSVPIIGIYDDHDFGENNANSSYPLKWEAKDIFLDFLDEDEESPRRAQEGIFTSYTFGEGDTKVKFILLDTRFHLTERGPEGDLLGEEQWDWLERELDNDARVNFIVSGISVLAPVFNLVGLEGWVAYPEAQKRLGRVLERSEAKGIVFLTGDRHFSATYKGSIEGEKRRYLELMSSGITHTSKIFYPYLYRIYDRNTMYLERNFSTIFIDWNATPVRLTFQIKSVDGVTRFIEAYEI